MLWCMRTTLTLDDDVAAHLERLRRGRGMRLRDLVNDALRVGLRQLEAGAPRAAPGRTQAVSLGPPRISSLDDVAEALAVAEGEAFR